MDRSKIILLLFQRAIRHRCRTTKVPPQHHSEVISCTILSDAPPPPPAAPATRLDLHTGWQLQSACVLQGSFNGSAGLKDNAYPSLDGETLSSPLYRPIGWLAATVPTAIVAAQVAAGIIKDPFYGMNLRKLPGMDYPIGSQFANLAMLDDSPYKCGWWYRTQFRVPASFAGRTVALHLDGVNYRADVWLNEIGRA